MNFNFKIHYYKESENAKADMLSRRPDYIENKSQTIQLVLSLQQNKRIIYNWQIITGIMIISNDMLEDIIQKEYLKNKQA